MTTGNTVRDGTYLLSGYPSTWLANGRKTGTYSSKVWSGEDDPVTTPVYKVLRNIVSGKFYRKKVRSKRRRIPHPYTMTAVSISAPPIQYEWWSKYPSTTPSVALATYYAGLQKPSKPATSPFGANQQIKLLNKLHEKIYGSDFNPAVFLAESGQTLGLIGEAAARLAASLAYLRKGNIREASRIIAGYTRHPNRGPRADRALATTVLEVQYGWRPLMEDMKSGAEWLAHALHAPCQWRYRVTGYAQQEVGMSLGSSASMWYASADYYERRQIIAYLSEQPPNAVLRAILSPEEVVWEKIPYSFVIDWAVPIGDYLRARGVASTLTGTFVVTSTLLWELLGAQPGTGGSNFTKIRRWFSPGTDNYYREVKVIRSVSTSLDVPLPTFKGLGKTLSMEHCLNGLSLLAVASEGNPDDVVRKALSFLGRKPPR